MHTQNVLPDGVAATARSLSPDSAPLHCFSPLSEQSISDIQTQTAMLDPYVKYMQKLSNPVGGEILRTGPDRPWGPPSPCTMSSGSFPGVKNPGRCVDHPLHLAPRVKKEYSYIYTFSLGLRGLF